MNAHNFVRGTAINQPQAPLTLDMVRIPQNEPASDELKDGKPVMCFHLHDADPAPVEWRS